MLAVSLTIQHMLHFCFMQHVRHSLVMESCQECEAAEAVRSSRPAAVSKLALPAVLPAVSRHLSELEISNIHDYAYVTLVIFTLLC